MIYFIYGDDTFRSSEYLQYLINHYQKGGPFYFSFDFADSFASPLDLSDLKEKFNSQNLFFKTRLIVLKNLIAHTSSEFQKDFLQLLEKEQAATSKSLMLIIYEGEDEQEDEKDEIILTATKQKKKPAWPWLQNKAKLIKEFHLLDNKQLVLWVKNLFLQFHLEASPEVIKLLAESLGPETGTLFYAVKKLSLISKRYITKQDLENNIVLPFNNNIFEFLDFLAARQMPQAFICLMQNILEDDSPQHMLQLLKMIIYEFRNLLMIKEAKAKNFVELQKQTQIKAYPLKKLLPLSKVFSLKELKSIYQVLCLYDEKIKRGSVTPALALQLLLLDMQRVFNY